ncbi:MAG: OmpA family protein [Synechococcaceae cyanobacterium SM2_3_1]|nr:OmpA family protein [Synechococcaceae cyanobacterium SM2_3_1]
MSLGAFTGGFAGVQGQPTATPPYPTPAPSAVATPAPIPADTAQIQAEIHFLRQELLQIMMRLQTLEAELLNPSPPDMPILQPKTEAEVVTPSPAPPVPDPPSSPASASQTPFFQVGTQTISLPGDVLFDFDKAVLRPEAEDLLETVATKLENMPGARILVAGHTDNIGGEEYNLALSLRRATAVQDYLIDLMPEDRQEDFSWSASGRGASQPLASNETEAGRQQNRRVDIILAP